MESVPNRWNELWERWRNITTDVDDGYVNWPSIHETNKRFSIAIRSKEGPFEALLLTKRFEVVVFNTRYWIE